jgi:hypothetical protein
MKSLLLYILFSLSFSILFAQNEHINSLINKLNNDELRGTCNYNWVVKNYSKEADSLILIGKSKTTNSNKLCLDLYNILTDTSKGIIAQYVLSSILNGETSSGGFFFEDEDETIEYQYGELRFYENKYRRMFTSQIELERNKKIWTVLFKAMGILSETNK